VRIQLSPPRSSSRTQIAKETRDTKYKKQKGGGGIMKSRRKGLGVRPLADDHDGSDEEEPMVVIRNGQAVRMGSAVNPVQAAVQAALDGDSDDDDERSTIQKKLRALRKKLRQVHDIKQRRRKGEELDAQQKAKLRTEAQLEQDIARFEEELGEIDGAQDGGSEDGGEAADEGEVEAVAVAVVQPTVQLPTGESAPASGGVLQQRRELKRQRHLEQLQRKRLALEAKKARK
jgi:hypothetical protein